MEKRTEEGKVLDFDIVEDVEMSDLKIQKKQKMNDNESVVNPGAEVLLKGYHFKGESPHVILDSMKEKVAYNYIFLFI